jgi:hypothetical protein
MDSIIRWAGAAVVANFVVFVVVTLVIGGDAFQGYSTAGHYFLNQKGHFTEVSKAIFIYSWWHTVSVLVTMPMMFILSLAWKHSKERFPPD